MSLNNGPNGIRIAMDPLRALYYTSLSTMSYTAMQFYPGPGAPAPFQNLVRILSISNNTNQDILVSDDFQNPKWYVAANGFIVRDFSANQDSKSGLAGLPIGTQLWVVSVNAPSSGYVYAECTYVSTIAGE